MRWERYIVGLVDLLGQSRKLDELSLLWWEKHGSDSPVEKDKSKRIAELTKATYEEVEYFSELSSKIFRMLTKRVLEEADKNTLTPVEKAAVTKMATETCTLRWFSDMIVFYAPFDSADELLTRFRIAGMLIACIILLPLEFKEGTFFRGGIEIEIAAELSNGEIYGPALVKAHRLEKGVAQHPRVVIGKRLSKFIQYEGQPTDLGESLNSVLASVKGYCKGFVCLDDDDEMIVDYLGKKASELSRFPGNNACDFVKRGMIKVENELSAARQKGDEKLVERYEKLQAYYQSRAKYWNWESIDANLRQA